MAVLRSVLRRTPQALVLRVPWLRRLQRPGLFGLDTRLEAHLDTSRPGYFVELGANDGYSQSNTWFLETEFGWHGVLIEACPAEFVQLMQNRSPRNQLVCAACVDFGYDSDSIRMRYSGLMSTAHGDNDLPDGTYQHAEDGRKYLPAAVQPFDFMAVARSLQSILDEVNAPKNIDLLSLDVEGQEMSVLKGIDHTRTRFGHLVVESRSPRELRGYLASHDYQFVEALSHHDYLFREGR